MLAKLQDDSKLCWDKHLDDITYCFNNTINKSIGETPAKLLFGRNQLGKIHDNFRSVLESFNEEDSVSLSDIRKKASEKIIVSQQSNQIKYDQKHKKPYVYKEGEYVMVANTDSTVGSNKKLIPKYRGPYEIKAV